MIAAVLLVLLVGGLAYFRAPILAWSAVVAIWLLSLPWTHGASLPTAGWVVFALIAFVLNIPLLRRVVLTGPFFVVFKKITPVMSQTEQEALNAGSVWWDRNLFSDRPD